MTVLEHYYIRKSKGKLSFLKMLQKKQKSEFGFQIFSCKEKEGRQRLRKIGLFDPRIEAEINL